MFPQFAKQAWHMVELQEGTLQNTSSDTYLDTHFHSTNSDIISMSSTYRILTAWFPTRERGTWWGFWTASNNIGGFAAPLVAGGAANHFGWRCVCCAPADFSSALVLLGDAAYGAPRRPHCGRTKVA